MQQLPAYVAVQYTSHTHGTVSEIRSIFTTDIAPPSHECVCTSGTQGARVALQDEVKYRIYIHVHIYVIH